MRSIHAPIGLPRSRVTRLGDGADTRNVMPTHRSVPGSLSLLEIGLVVILLGIALAVAVPEYMHLQSRGTPSGHTGDARVAPPKSPVASSRSGGKRSSTQVGSSGERR
jgi:hypothetical protein